MSVLPSYFLNLLSKPYDPDKKSLFLHFHGALSSRYGDLFVMSFVYTMSTVTLAILIDISEFFTTTVTSLFTKIN